MIISELIAELGSLQAEFGDLDVMIDRVPVSMVYYEADEDEDGPPPGHWIAIEAEKAVTRSRIRQIAR